MCAACRNASAVSSSPAKAGPSSTNVTGLTTKPSARCDCRQAVDAGSKAGSPVIKSRSTEVSTTQAISIHLTLPQRLHRLRRRRPRAGRSLRASCGDPLPILIQRRHRDRSRHFRDRYLNAGTFRKAAQQIRQHRRGVVLNVQRGSDRAHGQDCRPHAAKVNGSAHPMEFASSRTKTCRREASL